MNKAIFSNKFTYVILVIYGIILAWWIKLQFLGVDGNEPYLFNWIYGLIPLFGALYGIFVVARAWGGWKSIIGKGIILISLGLFCQWFGLQIWTYYNLIAHVEVPYPSLADLGYFGLIPFYTLGALMFAHAAGGKFSLRTLSGKVSAIVIALITLIIAYSLFVKDIGFDSSNPLKTFLDFGYPLGEILPMAIAIFTLSLSSKFLGGKMRSRIFLLIFAFAFQFFTEYMFLSAASLGTYTNAGINDLLYATSYTIMSIGLISLKEYE